MPNIGQILIALGIFLVVVGIMVAFLGRIPFIGKLPGDILIQKGNVTFFMPLTTSILMSIVLTIVLNLMSRGR